MDSELTFFNNLKREINDLFLKETRDWKKDIPAEYYWKECPISIPTFYKLEDDYFAVLVGIVKNLSEKYSCDIQIENWKANKIDGKIIDLEFEVCLPQQRFKEEIKKEKLRLAKINNEALVDIFAVVLDQKQARLVLEAIANGNVAHVKINY